jgi:hypothetical protein
MLEAHVLERNDGDVTAIVDHEGSQLVDQRDAVLAEHASQLL